MFVIYGTIVYIYRVTFQLVVDSSKIEFLFSSRRQTIQLIFNCIVVCLPKLHFYRFLVYICIVIVF